MDRHRLAVVVEHNDFQEPAGPVGTNVEITVALAHYAEGVANCVLDVFVGNTVLRALSAIYTYAGYFAPLLPCKLPCNGQSDSRTTIPCGTADPIVVTLGAVEFCTVRGSSSGPPAGGARDADGRSNGRSPCQTGVASSGGLTVLR